MKQYEFPPLNALLQPAVEALARTLGVKYIYVSPVSDQQRKILTKHYHYVQVDSGDIVACNILWGREEFSDQRRTPLYMKLVE